MRKMLHKILLTTILFLIATISFSQSNPDASNITVNAGAFTPVFSSSVTSYSMTVPYATTSVTLTPTTVEALSTTEINLNAGAYSSTPNGTASAAQTLNVGVNTVSIKVTSQDLGFTKTYTFTVTRSMDVSLSSFNIYANNPYIVDPSFSPSFTPGVFTYTCLNKTYTLAHPPTFSVSATSPILSLTILVDGNPILVGAPLPTTPGTHSLVATVLASDGTTQINTVTYSFVLLSSDASLSDLTISSGTMSPVFSSGTTAYTESVSYGISSVTVTPTVTEPTSTIQVSANGGPFAPVTSGSASSALALNVGTNTIIVKVTPVDPDPSAIKSYTITVTRNMDVSLSSFNIYANNPYIVDPSFSPLFTPGVFTYTCLNKTYTLAHPPTFSVSATSPILSLTILVDGNPILVGAPLPTTPGTHSLVATVLASDGTTQINTVTYSFVLLSSDASLSSLSLSSGTLTPVFSSGTLSYSATVANAVASVTVTPTVTDPTATIQVSINGGPFTPVTSGSASNALALNVSINPIIVKITPEDPDPLAIKLYTINVTRDAASGGVGGGGGGGLESKSLGDNLVKRIYSKAINNQNGPIDYAHLPIVSSNTSRIHTMGLGSISAVTLSDIMPDITSSGFVAYNSTPSDIITFTNAKEVKAIDFTSNKECKAVAFATKTQGFLYDHTKPICDRLKGASLVSVENMNIGGFDLVNYTLNNEKGQREYATSFSIGSKNGRSDFSIQSTWLTKDYIGDETMYNFQLWAATPELVKSMVMDIFAKLNSVASIKAISKVNIPSMFVLSGIRERTNLNLVLTNTSSSNTGYFILEDKNNEASTIINTRTIPFTLSANGKTNITIPMSDIYESTISMYVNGVLKDVVYMSDGTWYADYNKATTIVNSFTVSNDPNRNISADEFPLLRNVSLKANSPDYISIVKLMKGGGMEADLSLYKGLKFTASGGQSMHITLVKNSIVNWKEQYYADINLDQDQKDYFIGLDKFKSDVSSNKLAANDISSIAMSVIVSSGRQSAINTDLSNVSFTKEDLSYINSIDSKDIQVFPNPANAGKFNCTFYSNKDIELTLHVNDVTGRLVGSKQILAMKGLNKVSMEVVNITSGTHIISLVGSGVKYNSKKIVMTN